MKEILPSVFGAISENDNMLVRDDPKAYEKYFGVGLNALMVISNLLEKYNIIPKTILDLPSGFGRVTRFLRATYPNATIYASDINIQATRFCANFNVVPLPTTGHFNDLKPAIGAPLDLVWTGSLTTHTPESLTRDYFNYLSQVLDGNGLAIVTNHGESIVNTLSAECRYGLKQMEAVNAIKDGFRLTGFGYHDYPGYGNYGVACISNEWLQAATARSGLEILEIRPNEWAGQDVVVIRRRRSP